MHQVGHTLPTGKNSRLMNQRLHFGFFSVLVLLFIEKVPFPDTNCEIESQVDLVKDYWNDVFEPLVDGYERGLTPSPDIACNRSIKFGVFHDFCRERVGCDLVIFNLRSLCC